jgi:hypothetical protein
MQMKKIMPAMLVLWLFLPACSGGGGLPDGDAGGADDAGWDAGGADDAGWDAGGADDAGWDAGGLPDHDPESSFLLIIPPGARLYTVFCEGRTWQDEYRMKGRIDLIPGGYVLPRSGGSFDGELVAGAVFGPDRVPVQVNGPGSFEAVYYYGAWQYIFRQEYLLGAEPYHLQIWIWFEPYFWEDGWPAQVTLEGEFAAAWCSARADLGDATGFCQDRQTFCFHDLSSMPGVDHRGTTAGGDRVLVEIRHAQACQVAGNTGCEKVDRAELSLDGLQRVVSDPGALIYSAGHHNADQKYLLVLHEPIGETAAVLVESPGYGQTQGGALLRLDDDLQPLGSEPFVDWQSTWR